MINLGICIVPMMSTEEEIEIICAAEDFGSKYCLLCEEIFSAGVYITPGIPEQRYYSLENAQYHFDPQEIPVWVAPRGNKMPDLTGNDPAISDCRRSAGMSDERCLENFC